MRKLILLFIIFCSFNNIRAMNKESSRTIQKNRKIFISCFSLLPAEIASDIIDQVLEAHINRINIETQSKKNHKKMGPLTKIFFLYLFSTRIIKVGNKKTESVYILAPQTFLKNLIAFSYQIFQVRKAILSIPQRCLVKIKLAYPPIEEIFNRQYSLFTLFFSRKITNFKNLENKNIQTLEGLDCLLGLPRFPKHALYLSNNQITLLPPTLKNFSSLKTLKLAINNLTEFPPAIGNLSNLQVLTLSSNQIRVLPKELGNLCNLKEFYFSLNKLTKLPPELGNLSLLHTLKLTGNKLTTLPNELGNLSCLTYLDLAFNKLKTLPQQLKNLSALQNLNLTHNRLTDDLDIQLFVNLPLRKLILAHNKFSAKKRKQIKQALAKKRIKKLRVGKQKKH